MLIVNLFACNCFCKDGILGAIPWRDTAGEPSGQGKALPEMSSQGFSRLCTIGPPSSPPLYQCCSRKTGSPHLLIQDEVANRQQRQVGRAESGTHREVLIKRFFSVERSQKSLDGRTLIVFPSLGARDALTSRESLEDGPS